MFNPILLKNINNNDNTKLQIKTKILQEIKWSYK